MTHHKMNWIFTLFVGFAMTALILNSSCASIVSKSRYPITLRSTPSEARVNVIDKHGVTVYSGQTPANVVLKSSNGFFSRATYTVEFIKDGFEVHAILLESYLDAWYIGNLLFGGLIGMLIVDPLTGAMWKLDQRYINEHLIPQKASTGNGGINIYDLDDIPKEWKDHLVKVSY